MQQALNHQIAGQLADARALFMQALQQDPDNFDALHMLGVVEFQSGDAEAGARHILHAIAVAPGPYPPALTNLGLCLGAVSRKRGMRLWRDVPEEEDYCHPEFLRSATLPPLPPSPPGVTVVVPSRNHARYVGEALKSVYAQSYREIELIVIDDGSSDDSVALIRAVLGSCPFPHRFIAREGRGAHVTLNEGVHLAGHDWVAVLASDGRYAAQRIEWMLRGLEGRHAEWGYSGVSLLDGNSAAIPPGTNPRADSLLAGLEGRYRLTAIGNGFGRLNHAVSTGNLVFRKSLWQDIGGFSAHRHVHDWHFCMQALLRSEPVFVDEPLYQHRIHDGDAGGESAAQSAAESEGLIASWMERLSTDQPIANPTLQRHRSELMNQDWILMTEARGHLVGLPRLLKYANALGLA